MGCLNGRIAIVTGAARGIGRAIATRFIEEGARVAITDVLDAVGYEAAESLGSDCIYLSCDHTAAQNCLEVVEAVEQRWGRIDILHNNAAVSCKKSFDDIDENELQHVIQSNLVGPWHMTRAALPALRASAATRPGVGSALLYTASGLSFHAAPMASAYVTTKHGLIGIVRSLALELGASNIRVNAICPGIVPTEKLQTAQTAWGDPLEVLERYRQRTPLGRLAKPEDVAALAAFLASDGGRSISAQAILVNGGSDSH